MSDGHRREETKRRGMVVALPLLILLGLVIVLVVGIVVL